MKSSVAIALIVCGTILIVTPHLFHAVEMQQLMNTTTALGKPVSFNSSLPDYAHDVCMFGGVIMVVTGAIAGLRSGKPD